MAKAGFYAVAKGRVPGIYASWEDCEVQVKGFVGAKHKKFRTLREAEEFAGISSSSAPSTSTRSPNRARLSVPSVMSRTRKKMSTTASVSKTHVSSDAVSEEGYDVVYADGACKGNGQAGSIAGVGVWWGHNDPRNIAERCPGAQTNNRAELIAIARVLEQTPAYGRPLMIKSDSTYSIKCLQDWHQKWELNNWKTKSGTPVLNAGIIRYSLARLSLRNLQGSRVRFVYVKGHAGIEGNEGADNQANIGTRLPAVPERDWEKERVRIEKLVEELIQGVEVVDKAVQVEVANGGDDDDEIWKEVGDLDVEAPEASQSSSETVVPAATVPIPAPTIAQSKTPTAQPANDSQSNVATDKDEYGVEDLLSPEELEAELADALQ